MFIFYVKPYFSYRKDEESETFIKNVFLIFPNLRYSWVYPSLKFAILSPANFLKY